MWEEGHIGFIWSPSVELRATLQWDRDRKIGAMRQQANNRRFFFFSPFHFLMPRIDFKWNEKKWLHTYRRVETGSRSTMSYLSPKLIKPEWSAFCVCSSKKHCLLRDLYQPSKHTRLLSVFCTRICMFALNYSCWVSSKHCSHQGFS